MNVTGTITMHLDREQQMDLVIQVLVEDYSGLAREVQSILNGAERRALQKFEMQDYEDLLKDMQHIDGVLVQYMRPSVYDNWCSAWSKFRDLY